MSTDWVLQLTEDRAAPFDHILRWTATVLRYGQAAPPQVVSVGVSDPDGPDGVGLGLPAASLRRPAAELLPALRAIVIARGQSPRLIVAHRFKPVRVACRLAAELGDVPVLGVIHQFGTLDTLSRRLWLFGQRHRLILAGVSAAVTRELQQRSRWTGCRCITFGNGLDVADFDARALDRSTARARLRLAQPNPAATAATPLWAICAARMVPRKGHAMLLQAMARLRDEGTDLRLLLAGDGPLRTTLERSVAACGLTDRVHFAGRIDDLPRLLAAFDLAVLPARREAFGMFVAEAMASRVPVVAADEGGLAELVGDAGLRVPVDDAAAGVDRLSAALRTVATLDDAARLQLGRRGRERIETMYSPARCAAAWQRDWQDATG